MVTDHLLIRRGAAELDRALAGSRVRDLGIGDDGSFALVAGGRDRESTLKVLPFATPPLVWLEDATELSLGPEPPWIRVAGKLLRGLRVTGAAARPGDRLIRVDIEARSRFGVADRYTLLLELVPRFGNVVLLKDRTVVAAAKTFDPESGGRRIDVGFPYEEPPLGVRKISRDGIPKLVAASFEIALSRLDADAVARDAWLLAHERELEAAAAGQGPVHVYRREGEIVAVHLVPLLQYEELTHETSDRLLEIFREAAQQDRVRGGVGQAERRRLSLARALRERQTAIAKQLDVLAARESEIAQRDGLRRAGETIYAYLHQIPAGTARFAPADRPEAAIELDPQLTAKENAARYFERYRKAGASSAHLAKRRAALEAEAADIEQLLWEVERADPSALEEIAADLRGKPAPRATRRIVPLELPSGSRIYVGRSPRENEEITFRIARPNDLWFHARNVPGAHVVLHPGSGKEAASDEIAIAARLAAHHSRARGSIAVDVDYTARKHVRKQRDAGAGMVWYTNAKTVRADPAQAEAERFFR